MTHNYLTQQKILLKKVLNCLEDMKMQVERKFLNKNNCIIYWALEK